MGRGAARPPCRDRANARFAGVCESTSRGEPPPRRDRAGNGTVLLSSPSLSSSSSRVVVRERANTTGEVGPGSTAAGAVRRSASFGRRLSPTRALVSGGGVLPTVVVVVVVVVAAFGSTLSGVAASPRLLGAGVGLGGFAADLNVSTSSLSPPISRSYLASSALTLPGSRWLASRDARGASSCGPNASSCGALALSSRRISRIFVTVCTCACSSISITPSSSSSSSRAGVTFRANRAGEAPGLAVGP